MDDLSGMSIEELGAELAVCVRRKHWLEADLKTVNERAELVVAQLRAMPQAAGLDHHAPGEAQTERFRVPDYVAPGAHAYGRATTATRNERAVYPPAVLSPDVTERLVQPVECPSDCRELMRHIHTADGAVHPVEFGRG